MGSRLQVPAMTAAIRKLSPDLVKVLTPMREAVNRIEGAGMDRAARAGDIESLTKRIAMLESGVSGRAALVRAVLPSDERTPESADDIGAPTLEPPVFGLLESLDDPGAVIGRNDDDHDTNGADSSTWVTVYTFTLPSTGTITVRTNAWAPLVGITVTEEGKIRILRDTVVAGAVTDLSNNSGDQQVWNDIDVESASNIFEIQLLAEVQNTGDEDSNISWAEIRAIVSYVTWS